MLPSESLVKSIKERCLAVEALCEEYLELGNQRGDLLAQIELMLSIIILRVYQFEIHAMVFAVDVLMKLGL